MILTIQADGSILSKGTMYQRAAQTITHYTKVEDDINNYSIGIPCYMSGKVYKCDHSTDIWYESTSTDAQDCICSVQLTGTPKTFVGIVVEIDTQLKCIKFATHGDYLVYVQDSSIYSIGDELFYNDTNELQILDDDTIITAKIKRGMIGSVTGIVDPHYIAMLKS